MQEENKSKPSFMERITKISDEERLLNEEQIKKENQAAREKEEVQSAITEEIPKTKKCPYCAEVIQEEAIICRFCNRKLTKIPPVQTQGGVNKVLVQIDTAPKKRRKYRVRALIFGPMFMIGSFLAMIGLLSVIAGKGSGMFVFWLLVGIVGFIGLIVTVIQSWLAAP